MITNKIRSYEHYFYIDAAGKQKGTFSPEELGQESIKRDTLVWTQGMEQWKRAEEVDELQYLFTVHTVHLNQLMRLTLHLMGRLVLYLGTVSSPSCPNRGLWSLFL